jgi:uncharacterized protein (DUF2062 family)
MRLLRDESIGQNSLATGLAIGVFIACTPFYGLQNLIGLYFARRLHLHPLPVLLGAQISNPPMSFGLIAAAVCCGHFVLHGRLPALGDYHLHQTLGELSRYEWTQAYHAMQGTLGSFLLDWAIGSVIVGLTGGTLAFFIGHYAFTHLTKRRRHPPQSPQV